MKWHFHGLKLVDKTQINTIYILKLILNDISLEELAQKYQSIKNIRCKQNSCQHFDECTLERYYDPTEPDIRSDLKFYIFCRRNWTQYLERMRWNCFLNISQLVLENKIEIKYVKPAIESEETEKLRKHSYFRLPCDWSQPDP